MAFTPIAHEFVGTIRAYLPLGCTPYALDAEEAGLVILPAGDTVDVLSAWTREYLPTGSETLLYVRSHATGHSTHVTESDLRLK